MTKVTEVQPSIELSDDAPAVKKSLEAARGAQPGPTEKDEHELHERTPVQSEEKAQRRSSVELARPAPLVQPPLRRASETVGVLGRTLLVIICAILVVTIFFSFVALGVGIAAGNGALSMFVGNIILRSTNHSGYVTDRTAAIIGAVGGIFGGLIVGIIFSSIIPKTSINANGEADHAWWVRAAAPVLAGVLTGAIGLRIMEKHMDVEGFQIIHAVRAGAVGGAVTSLGAIFIYPIVFVVVGLLLTPLWLFMIYLTKVVSSGGRTSGQDSSAV